MLRPQAQAKGLRFVVETLGTMPAWIRADAKRLRQILINLLSNAVRFTERGEVRLRMDFRQHVSRIEVIDTGIGIEPQDLERIFVPFERGSAGRRASEAGTGLGLTITHLLTELMGGQLTLTSTPGQGSTFTVRLYLPGMAADPHWTTPSRAALRSVIGYLAPQRTLLVVDDQPLQRQLLAGLLVPLGFAVREAASGRECLEIVRQTPPDLVLLDISMDDLDGWQTAALLRELRPAHELPIVFVSANLFEHEASRLAAQQCQGFVGKPVIESELLQALEQALQLEWVRDNTPLAHAPRNAAGPVDPHDTLATLPVDLRENLARLARSGQAAALREQLRHARAELPNHQATLALLQACADRFDFEALAEHLRAVQAADA
jgi:CheY-like chemotaxis protein/anti-sigma regulatory factor (Ser/Thr protein kinase)